MMIEVFSSTFEAGHRILVENLGDGAHHHFKIHALKESLGLAPGTNREQILKAMQDKVLDSGEIIGIYDRKED